MLVQIVENLRHGASVLAVAAAGLTMPALAQQAAEAGAGSATNTTSPAPQAERGLSDIIVTARRQAENQQTTPVAVTAFNAEALKTAQVLTVSDMQRAVPGLNVAAGAPSGTGFAFVAIRGQGNLDAGLASDPAVGTYIDGVYIPRPSQAMLELTDLAQAEVLRGPQGTLFGRNTTGGAINLTTGDPVDRLEVGLRASYGNYDTLRAGVLLNAPLAEDLAFRGTFDYTHSDGYGYNPQLDRRLRNNESPNARVKLRWQPGGGDFKITLAADYARSKDHGQIMTLAAVSPFSVAGPALQPFVVTKDTWYISNGTQFGPGSPPPFNDTKAYGGAATVEGKIGEFDIKSITAYRYSNSKALLDSDSSPVPLLTVNPSYLSKQWSQELQLSGKITDQWNFITGLYYSRETGTERVRFASFGGPASLNDGDLVNTTFGVFGQTYYNLTDKLRLSGGLRWTWDKRKATLHNLLNETVPGSAVIPIDFAGTLGTNCQTFGPEGPAGCAQVQQQKFDYPAFTAGVDYKASQNLFLYANVSRASHAGGINLRLGSVPTYAPERVISVEAGAKMELFDRRLRLNLAAFHSWTNNAQRTISDVVPGTTIPLQYIANSGKFQIDGVELEARARPWEGMELSGTLAYADGSYDNGTFLETRVDPVTGQTYAFDRSGEPLKQNPKWQYSFGATQTIPTSVGELSIHADYSHVGSQYFSTVTADPRDVVPAAIEEQFRDLGRTKGYGLLNARVALTLDNPNLEIAAFARNLTQEKYATRAFPDLYTGPLGIANIYVGEPRTYGISLIYKFGSE